MTATTVAAMAVLVVLTAGPATAKEFATLRVLAGTVEVQKGSASDFEPAADGQTLRERDTVRTGSDGRAEIEYFDGSITRLDFDTTFRLKRLESNPDEPGSKVIVAEQESGRSLERVVALTGSESRFEVEAPTATASVLGTEYVLTVHPDGTTELWVTDGEVVTTLEDGTELIVAAGQGVRINSEGDVEGPFQLTDEQLADPWLLYNDCDLDGVEREECAEPEVEGEVIENEQEDPPPADPPAPEPTVEPETADPDPVDNDPPADQDSNEPSDRRPITVTLSWSSGPSNLDLHVLTPDADDDEGGEVWHGNPCLQRSDGSCWATASGNAAAFGSESVTLSPTGSPEAGDWAAGPYDIWVENFSCSDGTYEDSDATVTVSRGGSTIASMTPAGGSGDPASSTWSTGSVAINQRGSATVAAASSFSGETCGPPEEEEVLVKKGELDPANSVIQEIPVAPKPPGDEADASGGGGNGDGNGGDGSPPATEPDDPPDSTPPEEEDPEPDPEPSPDPDPSPTPEPESTPTPEPSPTGSGTEEGTI